MTMVRKGTWKNYVCARGAIARRALLRLVFWDLPPSTHCLDFGWIRSRLMVFLFDSACQYSFFCVLDVSLISPSLLFSCLSLITPLLAAFVFRCLLSLTDVFVCHHSLFSLYLMCLSSLSFGSLSFFSTYVSSNEKQYDVFVDHFISFNITDDAVVILSFGFQCFSLMFQSLDIWNVCSFNIERRYVLIIMVNRFGLVFNILSLRDAVLCAYLSSPSIAYLFFSLSLSL
jgi:hypothetical protein